MFVENFCNFIKCYGEGRKIKLLGFFILSLLVGFMEFVGIALVYPFILLIITPNSIVQNKYYIAFTSFSHVNNVMVNAFLVGLLVIILFVVKNLFMIFSVYLQNKFTLNWKLAINNKFMYYYLFSPYKNSLDTSPSEKIYNLNFLINQTLNGFIFRVINLIISLTIIGMILILLFIKFPLAAIITCLFIFFSMSVQNKLFKNKITEISKKLFRISIVSNEKTMECINNIKDIKILSAEKKFFNEYVTSQKNFNDISFKNGFYGGISPYIVEILAVLSLLILGGIISLQNIENPAWMIASYAVVAAAIFRIAPSLNRIQSAINSINTSRGFVKIMIDEAEKLNFVEEKPDMEVKFNNSIRLNNVSFAYKKEPVIKDLNLEIKKGEFVGIVGLSGAGKSTLADIIMGLLPIDEGSIFVDDVEFNQQNFSSLRRLIGYVPQQINILDGSFKRNVAWGLDENEIDDKKVMEVLRKAQLETFINKFKGGINANAIIGASGLSQGQKQRLAIARALYRDSKILIFDEATSSLDVETEHEITEILNELKDEKTIIAIAHRLSTLKSCDRLIYLKDGKIIDTGTFTELSKKHPDFKNLIKLSSLTECK
ncbi:MAG: ABC transporter ATP-binding protein [Candidatus Gastranaerophilales bacterium]|nr:ABC transporter ATP-binding protein [Candidatus Gastranaerophilales bacterium]